jgi:hypothetical protein
MTFLKTSFAIALLACFLSVKTNAQVGLTVGNHMKKSIVIAPKNHIMKLKPNVLSIPKISYRETPQCQSMFVGNARDNAFNVILSRHATVLERAVGVLVLFAPDRGW